jgi:hypothetical protein
MMTMSIAWLRRSRSSVSKSRCGPRGSGEVVDGHLRLKAAKKLGMTEVPMILHDEWIEAQVKAFRLMVNRSVGWAGWDEELLGLELLELKGLDFDLDLTGFDSAELERCLTCSVETPPRLPTSSGSRQHRQNNNFRQWLNCSATPPFSGHRSD